MKLLPTMVPKATASTHKHHLLEAAVLTSTKQVAEQGLQDDAFRKVMV
jgi:hypothetical protein